MDQLEELQQRRQTRKTVFQMDFYSFLKRIKTREGVAPATVLQVLLANPGLVKYIQRKKYQEFLSALRQASHEATDREVVYVTLFYDAYYKSRSFVRAAVAAGHYRLDKFSKEFVHNTFLKYPFLRSPRHLDSITKKLSTSLYACLFTRDGIKEEY
jgi:hypothetical protein